MGFEDTLLIGSAMKQSCRRLSDASGLRNPIFVGKTNYSAHGGIIPQSSANLKWARPSAHEICKAEQVLAQ